jgi:hypothetical protein
MRWLCDTKTSSFLYPTAAVDDPTGGNPAQTVVDMGDAPVDPAVDRYDPTSLTLTRPATADEIAAYNKAAFESAALAEVAGDPKLTALSLALHTVMLGRVPTEAEQLSVFRNVKVFYQALLTSSFPVPAAAVAPSLS